MKRGFKGHRFKSLRGSFTKESSFFSYLLLVYLLAICPLVQPEWDPQGLTETLCTLPEVGYGQK